MLKRCSGHRRGYPARGPRGATRASPRCASRPCPGAIPPDENAIWSLHTLSGYVLAYRVQNPIEYARETGRA
eukprot:5856753-Prymnesium_polylepis.1